MFLIVVLLAGPIAITYQLVGSKLLVVHNAARKFLVPKKKKQQRKSATEVELAFRVANKAEEGVVSDDVIVLNGKAVAMAKICSCGNPFKGDSEFCRKCGIRRLTVEEAEIPSMAAPKETKALGEVPKAAGAKVRLATATTAPRGLAPPPRLPSSRGTPPPVSALRAPCASRPSLTANNLPANSLTANLRRCLRLRSVRTPQADQEAADAKKAEAAAKAKAARE